MKQGQAHTTTHTFCRICEATCGLEVDVEDNRVVAIRPDPKHVISKGYACVKGTRWGATQHSPDRVLHPLKRVGDRFVELSWDQAIGEIAAKLRQLIDRHGPDVLAHFVGSAGGAIVLSMARMGVNLDAVASFHGALGSLPPVAPGGVKARVLVLNGEDDPMITPQQIEAFEKEMDAANASYEFVNLPHARHSFTNPDAAKAGMDALAYNPEADKDSWARMLKMFGEVFGKK